MFSFSRGQKQKLGDITPSLKIEAEFSAQGAGLAFDFSCFGVDAQEKLSDDRYFVFYNQTASPQNEITMQGNRFSIDLERLPATLQKLVFVMTIDGNGMLSQLENGFFQLSANGSVVARFDFKGSDFGSEKAIIAAEIYLKDVWRIAAVGQGFSGGLDALLKHFGGEASEDATPAQAPHPVAAPVAPPAPKLVSLQKAGSSVKISLDKNVGEIVATAIWVDNGDSRSDNDDLDLRAGILWPDGSMSIVTCTKPGSLQTKPYVMHEGDVRNASQHMPGQESMKVNSQIAEHLAGDIAIVFSIYSAIANGPVSIASLKPQMKLQYGSQIVECALDFTSDREACKSGVYTYVIGLAVIRNGQIEISPGGQVSKPASEATPWLTWDGNGGVNVTMDGPAVVKSGGKALEKMLNLGNKKRYV